MKSTARIAAWTCLVLTAVLFSCTKEEPISNTRNSEPGFKSSAVFTVSPSGNYTDDAANIQDALNSAVTAGPGSTVQLTAGTFYLSERIEIDGFDGYFMGAGKTQTLITTHDQVISDITNGDQFALIKFRHGNLRMSDLRFEITLSEPCDVPDFFGAFPALIMVTGNSLDVPATTEQKASASFLDIDFIGSPGLFWDQYNLIHFIWIGAEPAGPPPYEITQSIFSIAKCYFKTAPVCFTNYSESSCQWTVGGKGSLRNNFEDAFNPIQLGESNNSHYEISYNTFKDIYWGSMLLSQGMVFDPATLGLSQYYVHHNDIAMADFGDGILIIDDSYAFGGPKLIDAVVSNNQIYLDEAMGGIYGEGGKDIIVSNNKIWGTSLVGIYIPTWYDFEVADNWQIKANNVVTLQASAVHIYLGSGTSNFEVIGGPNMTYAIDNGTNNYLTGVTLLPPSNLGHEIQEAMKLKHEIIKELKSQGGK